MEPVKVAIIGGGAFGTALACVASRAGNDTLLYLRDAALAQSINLEHKNQVRLPDIVLPNDIHATIDKTELADCQVALFAVPAQQTRHTAAELAPYLNNTEHIVACAKGIEQNSGLFQHQILAAVFKNNMISALSGPSFASDIARQLPTALSVASSHLDQAKYIASVLSTPSFRLYSNDDLIGVEVGGTLKNVIAIAVGAVRGMALGASAEAALIARGFAEMQRLGKALGAKQETLTGLSGLGDLVLTCSSPQSRNFAYGMALGSKHPLDSLALSEGVYTAKIAARIAAENNIEVPIISTVARVLEREISTQEAVDALLSRPLRSEIG